MKSYPEVIETFERLGMSYKIVEHPPAETTAQADAYIAGMGAACCKTLLLTNKKKTAFYLIIMDDDKRIDMDWFKGADKYRMRI